MRWIAPIFSIIKLTEKRSTYATGDAKKLKKCKTGLEAPFTLAKSNLGKSSGPPGKEEQYFEDHCP